MQIFCSYIYFSVESRERRLLQNHCSPSRRPCLGHPPQQEVGHLRSIATNGHRHNGINNNTTSINAGSSSKRRGVANNSQAPHPENSSLLDTVLSRKEHQHFPPSSSTTHPSLIGPRTLWRRPGCCRPQGQSVTQPCERERSRLCFSRRASGLVGSNGQHQADAGHGAAAPSTSAARASTQSSLTTTWRRRSWGRLRPGWQLHHP